MRRIRPHWLILIFLSLLLCGCGKTPATSGPTEPLAVSVSKPVERVVTDYAEFIGRTEAVDAVEIKARVTGYLLKAAFQEGSDVKSGDVLFEIDPRTYQAQLAAAEGQVEVAETKQELAQAENARAKALYQDNPRAISLKALDQHQAAEDAASAEVVAAKGNMEVYKLNLEFTKVTSPIDGRVGRNQVGIGNLVTENATTLTTVVSQDPIYVYFNIDERTMLEALRRLYAGQMPPLKDRKVQVLMGLQDDEGFPHQGVADYASNQVDASTGTLTLRAAFDNPKNEGGVRLFMPGLFVRVRLALSKPEPAILVAEAAIGTDQDRRFVYLVDDAGTVAIRTVTLGALQLDGLRVVKTGLNSDETVLVSGIQLVRSGEKVKPKTIPMPLAPTGAESAATNESKPAEQATGDEASEEADEQKASDNSSSAVENRTP